MSGRQLPPHGRPRAIRGLRNSEISAVELLTIKARDSVCNSRVVRESDESKPSWLAGDPINRQKDLDNLSHLRKEAGELALGRIIIEISDKDF